VKGFARNFLMMLSTVVLFVTLAWFSGLTPDGILYGHWTGNDDHPTNWCDTVLHPDAQ
jgi:hypothetical protein